MLKEERDRDNFILALWFHDAIYDGRDSDNEAQSCLVFNQFAEKANLESD